MYFAYFICKKLHFLLVTFSSSWYCPINYPNQCRMKNKHLILAILFTQSCTFSSTKYFLNNYPNQCRMKKILILDILFTHNCIHSLTVCKIITFSKPVKFLYPRSVNKMFQCQIFAELCVIKMDLFNRLDLESNKKSLQIMNLQYACGCF